jgi:hypothetical protein
MGWKKKEERTLFKNRISAATERRREIEAAKSTRSWRGGERVYVLFCMFATFPTCHLERSPLKAPAPRNTAPHENTMSWKKKRKREHCLKIELVLPQKKKKG